MLKKNSLENSKVTNELNSIFSFTEVKSKAALPSIKSTPALAGYHSKLTPTQSTWDNFIKRKKYLGNLSPREICQTTKDYFSGIEEKTILYSLNREFNSNIKKNSSSRGIYLSKDLDNYKQSVLNKKSVFNKVHNTVREKQKILAGLVDKLVEFQVLNDGKHREDILKGKNFEYKQLEIGTDNETTYSETLRHMMKRIKLENLGSAEPIVKLNKNLSEVKQEIFVTEKILFQISANITEFNNKYEIETNKLNQLKHKLTHFSEEKSKIFEGKIQLKLSVENEKKRILALSKKESGEKRLKSLQSVIEDYRKIELIKGEILEFQEFCEGEREKFETIKKVTNVKKIEEILTHYNYLVDTKQKLMESVNFSLLQIENLNTVQKSLIAELEELKFKANFASVSEKEIQGVENSVVQKGKFIERYEDRLLNLEMIIVTAIGTFARISELLGLDESFCKLRLENLLNCVNASYLKLQRLIENQKIKEESESSLSSIISLSDNQSVQLTFN